MICITLLSGPYANQTREIPKESSPIDFLGALLEKQWDWSIDYSQANEEEQFAWFVQDLSYRVIRALKDGRPVQFSNNAYQLKNPSDPRELANIAGQIEDAIISSRRLISIESDDAMGLKISDMGHMQ